MNKRTSLRFLHRGPPVKHERANRPVGRSKDRVPTSRRRAALGITESVAWLLPPLSGTIGERTGCACAYACPVYARARTPQGIGTNRARHGTTRARGNRCDPSFPAQCPSCPIFSRSNYSFPQHPRHPLPFHLVLTSFISVYLSRFPSALNLSRPFIFFFLPRRSNDTNSYTILLYTRNFRTFLLTSCAKITCQAEFFIPKSQHFLSFKYI